MTRIGKLILSSLAYHSIFDYPLTIEEIHSYLISGEIASLILVRKAAKNLLITKRISLKNGFVIASSIIHRPSSIAALRLRRQKISAEKMKIAKRASGIISIIPWVKMVAVTGALAMENADENDDIDLMVVTAKNRLWIVRPLATILISIFFKRRRPIIKGPALGIQGRALSKSIPDVSNSICLNLWLDESALEIPVDQRNLYTAHELAQMKPVVNRDGIYEEMMRENRWGEKFLANAWERLKGWQVSRSKKSNSFNLFNLLNLLNFLAFNLQFQFMKPKITNERVSLHSAFFHPGNRADTILEKYDSLCYRHF